MALVTGLAVSCLANVDGSLAVEPARPFDLHQIRSTILETLPRLRAAFPPETRRPPSREGRPSGAGLFEGTELYLAGRIGKFVFNDEINAHVENDRLYIDAEELFVELDFPIDIDLEQGRLSGWYLKEDNLVQVDLASGRAEVGDRQVTLEGDDVIRVRGRLFLSLKGVATLFDIQIEPDYRALLLDLDSADPLPFEEKLQRRDRAARILRSKTPPSTLPPTPGVAPRVPILELQSTRRLQVRDSGTSQQSGSHTVGGSAAVGAGRLDLFASGTDDDPIQATTVTIDYESPERDLLGRAEASEVTIGDVSSVRQTLLGSGGQERGIYVSNRGLGTLSDTGSTVIEGDVPPDWDIELYRDGVLIDFQTSGTDGRYEFPDVPIISLKDEIKLVLLGPQGQRREEIVPLDPDIDVGRKVVYQVSLTQQNTKLASEITEDATGGDTGIRPAGNIRYVINPALTAQAGAEILQSDGRSRVVSEASLEYNPKGRSARVRFAKDWMGGEGIGVTYRDRLGPLSFRAEQQYFSDFMKADGSEESTVSETDLDLSVRVKPFKKGPSFSAQASGSHELLDSDRQDVSLVGALSASLSPASLSNQVTWSVDYGPDGESSDSVDGLAQASLRIYGVSFQGRLEYDISPVREIDSASLSASWTQPPYTQPQIKITRNQSSDSTELSALAKVDLGKATLTPRLTVDDSSNGSLFLSLQTNLLSEPFDNSLYASNQKMRQSGTAIAQVFIDEDEDGTFGPGDVLLPEVGVSSPQLKRRSETNESGVAVLTNLRPYIRTDLVVDRHTLEDPYLLSAPEGYSVRTRPGLPTSTALPVVRTWRIPGRVVARDAQGLIRPVSGVPISPRSLDGFEATSTVSEPDGVFEFSFVRQGVYEISANPAPGLMITGPRPQRIGIGRGYTPIENIDLVLADDGQLPYVALNSLATAAGAPPPTAFIPLHEADDEAFSAGTEQASADVSDLEPEESSTDTYLLYLGKFRSRFGLYAAWSYLYSLDDQLDLPPALAMPSSSDNHLRLYAGPERDRASAESLCAGILRVWRACSVVPVPAALVRQTARLSQ